jgi:hypothetical protein
LFLVWFFFGFGRRLFVSSRQLSICSFCANYMYTDQPTSRPKTKSRT